MVRLKVEKKNKTHVKSQETKNYKEKKKKYETETRANKEKLIQKKRSICEHLKGNDLTELET